MNDLIGVGLIGHGLAGAAIHAPLIEATKGYKITAIATRRRETLAVRRHAPRAVTDPFELIAQDDVDLVVIASPNDTHYVYAEAALRAGKAVVIDKPFVLDVIAANNLIALANSQSAILTVFHNRRLDGNYIKMRETLRSGVLGEPYLTIAHWDRFRPQAGDNWRNGPDAGAGIVWDLGAHMIDQAIELYGLPDAVSADMGRQRPSTVAEDYFSLCLRYGERRCILSASSVVAAARPRFEVHGTTGSLSILPSEPYETPLREGRHPADSGFFDGVSPGIATIRTADGESCEALAPSDWTQFYAQLRRAIDRSEPVAVRPEQARDGIAVIAASFRSVQAGSAFVSV